MRAPGEVVLSVDEEVVLEALDFAPELVQTEIPASEGAVALGGVSSVILRAQQEAAAQSELIAAGAVDLNIEATAFNSN